MKIKSVQLLILFLLVFFTIRIGEGFAQKDKKTTPMRSKSKEALIFSEEKSPQSTFAAHEISKSLKKMGFNPVLTPLVALSQSKTPSIRIILATLANKTAWQEIAQTSNKSAADLKKEGFFISKSGEGPFTYWVIGNDEAGLMYGGFELAELIETQGMDAIKEHVQNPYMAMRGVKFNIPLDVRTPSYSDVSDAAQHNITEMWNFEFWKEYIDSLAKYRYNYISLWSLHPFPSLVKVPDYPDIALDDVHRSTVKWKENYSLNGHHFDAPEIVNQYEVLKKIAIHEKIDFWRKVMRYGKERNVDMYVVTWNIFTNGTFGKYGITDKIDNQTTRDYFRKSVKQLFLTYPDLAGIGLTTGENMYGHSTVEKEDWAYDTYAQGVLDVVKEQPGRKITFIHRQHQTGALDIAKKFAPLIEHKDIRFLFSFKYAQAHVYSSTNQVSHQEFVQDIEKDKHLKTIWTLRNDDIFYFRWGAPDFVREFIKKIPYDVSEGYYYGSDQYIWGREFLSKAPQTPRQLEIAKHWYHWMMWGRLGYNPEMGNDAFVGILQARFAGLRAEELFAAWQAASLIYPLTTGFHWGALDFQWYIESGQSRSDPAQTPSGYHDVNRFISLPPHKGTGYMSIPDYVNAIAQGSAMDGITPLEVAAQIKKEADTALQLSNSFAAKNNAEVDQILDDIRSMAYLGLYYAHKIRAATQLALFRETLKKEHRDKLLEELNSSAGFWRYYASLSISNYQNPLWTNRVGHVDWKETYAYVLYDIIANGGAINVPSMQATPGGTILEAEDAVFSTSTFKSNITGFTGKGYLDSNYGGDAKQSITWTYTAPEEGTYIVEFRYSLKRQEEIKSPVGINGKR